jgi:hypothetical protein
MKFVEFHEGDEVFVKLKEIENPGHPYDFVQVWVAGVGGGSDPKKSKAHESPFFFLW